MKSWHEDVVRRLRYVEQHHDKVAAFGGVAAEQHMRMQTTAVDAMVLLRALADLHALVSRVQTHGGSIVCSSQLTREQIAIALAADRVLVTEDGICLVYVPGPKVPTP